eukprot:gene6398-6629_t
MLCKEVEKGDNSVAAWIQRVKNFLFGGLQADIFEAVDNDEGLANIHDQAEKFDTRTEQVFKYLQVISACAMSFAHGANDVANAVGPFAAIYGIYKYGYISRRNTIEPWMLAGIGATGIVAGLATYGWKICRVLGVKLTAITPSRGFTMETTSALVVAFGSYLGIPLSTTQVSVGATAGVGLAENRSGAIRWTTLLKMFSAWVFTLVIGALISATLFAFGGFAPSIRFGQQIIQYQQQIKYLTDAQLSAMDAAAAKHPATVPPNLPALNAEWYNLTSSSREKPFPVTTVLAETVLPLANQTSELFMNYSTVSFAP